VRARAAASRPAARRRRGPHPSGVARRPVKLRGARLEGADHLAQRLVEHLAGQHFEDAGLEGEIDREIDEGAALPVRPEAPVVGQMLERPFEIVDMDAARPRLVDLRGEALGDALEADHEVRDHLVRVIRSHPHRDHPGQELAVACHVRDQIEHLLGAVGQLAGLGVAGHRSLSVRSP